ncbi:thiamine transporter ThiT [Povalibacter uvarum]|uniref:Thiamine transporter ThiT n=1 Tax=Povalibacter uvarum TaxID=732238 RepID=A0A841HGE1_9GAMM|nr:Yip1 family protein [Povalibacter uvarum]MBB6091368.1 thiamine transporter ThiT [Povalibacter uvarum]
MDFNKLIARVKAILLTPKTEWPVIAGEPATTADLYKNYILLLAAIPAIVGFIKMSVIGISIPFAGTIRIGFGAGLVNMLVTYGLSLVMVFVMALIIDALAPSFGGQKDQTQALKTVAYAYTASWVAGFAHFLPWIGWLVMLAGGIYGIYLLYLGLPHTMKCPQEKAPGYTVVAIIIAIVLGFVIGIVAGAVSGVSSVMSGATFSSGGDDVQFDKDSSLGKLEQWSKEVEKAGKQMEAAEKSGNQQAQADAMKALMGAALGGGNVESLEPDRLKAFLPESLDGRTRGDVSVERNAAMGLQISEARASYANEAGETLRLEITDTGSAKGLLAFAGWAGVEGEKQTGSGYEKTYREDGRIIHEEWHGDSGEYATVVGDRFTVKVSGSAGSIDDLKDAVSQVDLGGLEDLKGEGVKTN